VIGKAEGIALEWHVHVTAITVAPEYRRLGLAQKMMDRLELVSDHVYKGYFVDLYVRCNNEVALFLYGKLGYSIYRRVINYYGSSTQLPPAGQDAHDAFDMRKPLSRDALRRSVRSNGQTIHVTANSVS